MEKILRKDMPRHLKEEAQQHMMATAFLNLQLTRELQDQIKKKDEVILKYQEIVKEKDAQLEGMKADRQRENDHITQISRVLQQGFADLQVTVKEQSQFHQQVSDSLSTQIVTQFQGIQSQLQKNNTTLLRIQAELLHVDLSQLDGFNQHDLEFIGFSKFNLQGKKKSWLSESFYTHDGGYFIKLVIEVDNLIKSLERDPFISAYLQVEQGKYDDGLQWPINCLIYLQLVNQLGNHGHHGALKCDSRFISRTKIAENFLPIKSLYKDVFQNTQYLNDDCLHLKLYLKFFSK